MFIFLYAPHKKHGIVISIQDIELSGYFLRDKRFLMMRSIMWNIVFLVRRIQLYAIDQNNNIIQVSNVKLEKEDVF